MADDQVWKPFSSEEMSRIQSKTPEPEPNPQAAVYAARNRNPDEEAAAQRLAASAGVTVEAAKGHGKGIAADQAAAEIDYQAMARESPALSKWIADQRHADKAHDDIVQMSSVEQFIRKSGNQFLTDLKPLATLGRAVAAGGTADTAAGVAGIMETFTASLSEDIGKPLAGVIGAGDPFARMRELFAGDVATFRAAGDKIAGPAPTGIVEESVVGGVRSFGSQAAGMAATLATKNPAYMLGAAGAQAAGQAGHDALAAGVDPDKALLLAVSQGGVEVTTEMIPALRLLSDMKMGSGFFKTLFANQATEQVGEQVATVWQDINEAIIVTPDKTLAEFMAERPEAAVRTAIATLAQGVVQVGAAHIGSGIAQEVDRRKQAGMAEQHQQYLTDLGKLTDATKMAARDPDGLSGLVTQMAEEGGTPTKVFIDAADLGDVLNQSGMTLADFADLMPDHSSAIIDASITGGVIEIPIGEALTKLKGTEIEKALLPHVRLTEDGFSKAQADEFIKGYDTEQTKRSERILAAHAEDSEFRQSAMQIRNQVADELVATGRMGRDAAVANARLTESFFVTAARDFGNGMTPGTLFSRVFGGRKVVVGENAAESSAGTFEQEDNTSSALDDLVRDDLDDDQVFQNKMPDANEDGLGYVGKIGGSASGYGGFHVSVRGGEVKEFGPHEFFFHDDNDKPIGFARLTKSDKQASVSMIAFTEDERGQGYARAFYKYLLDDLGLEVKSDKEITSGTAGLYRSLLRDHKGKVDADGRVVIAPSALLTDKPEFKAWFGDSKVVDAEGKPLVVYHGTTSDIEQFDESARGKNTGAESAKAGFFFTDDTVTADSYGNYAATDARIAALLAEADKAEKAGDWDAYDSKVVEYEALDASFSDPQNRLAGQNAVPVYLSIRNPLVVDAKGENAIGFDITGAVKAAVRGKHDGLIIRNLDDAAGLANRPATHYVAFKPTQIKSVFNRGTYDSNDPNVLNQGNRRNGQRRNDNDGGRRVTDQQLFEKPVSEMTAPEKDMVIEELRVQALVSELTGLGSKLAWKRTRATNPMRFVASIDADGLAWVNDNMGHDSGDELLAMLGDAFAASGVTAYHISGDEFWMQGDDETALRDALEAARQKINDSVVSSDKWSVTGQSFSYGIAEHPKIAEEALQSEKAERQAAGLRAERKTRPAGARAAGEPGFVPSEAAGDGEGAASDGESEGVLDQQARGTFRPADFLTTLNKASNLTTFLHESGHGFLDMTVLMAQMPDAPQEIKDRAAAVLKWLGVTGSPEVSAMDSWLSMTLEEKRPLHEKWAETFEQYLFTGKAPSIELASAFSRFRDWMVSVYKTLKGMAKQNKLAALDPEVTEIFDRLLATDAQIAEASAARAVLPLFASKPESMTPEAWRSYMAQVSVQDQHQAHVIDRAKLSDMKWLRKKGGKLLKAMQKDAAEKRKAVRVRASRLILTQPAYRVRQLLTGKVKAEPKELKGKDSRLLADIDTAVDSAAIAIAKMGGMNEAAAVAEWGLDPSDFNTKDMRAGHKRPVMVKKGGLAPGDIGERLAELGYIPQDAAGKYDNQAIENLLDQEARGNPQYSNQADWGALTGGNEFSKVQEIVGDLFGDAARLQSDEMARRFGHLPIERLGKMVAESGMPADLIAGAYGFDSAEAMVSAVIETKDIREAIDELTDKMLLEEFGDITSPEALQRAVDAALMDAGRSRIIATEIALVSKSLAGRATAMVKAARMAAESIIRDQKVGDVRADRYRLAATRASREAEKALGANNVDLVVSHKRTQMLNVELAREAEDVRGMVAKKLTAFRKMFAGKDEDVAKRRNMDMVMIARAVLARHGVGPKRGGEAATKYLGLIAEYSPETAADIASIMEMLPANETVAVKDMTVAEFQSFTDVVEALWNKSRTDKEFVLGGLQDAMEMEEVAGAIVSRATELSGGSLPINPLLKGTATKFDKFIRGMRSAKVMGNRIESWCDMMGEDFTKFIFRPVSNAITRHMTYRGDLLKKYTALLSTIESGLTTDPIVAKDLDGFVFSGGKMELLHAVLHAGNQSNLRKLLLGRTDPKTGKGWATVNKDGSIDTSKWDAFFLRMQDEGVITEADMQFCQGVWDLLEGTKVDAQKAHHDMYGYYFGEITASPVITKYGVFRGGYVPAMADRSDPSVAPKMEAEDVLHAGNSFMFPTTGKGFTKGRVDYNKPLELDLRTIGSHLDKVSRFVNVEPQLRNVARLLQRDDVAEAINAITPDGVGKMLNPWLQRSARQSVSQPGMNRMMDSAWRYMRVTAGASVMAGNVANALQQLTGFTLALLKVPAPFLARALVNYTRNPLAAQRDISSKSEWMKHRLSGQSFEMQARIDNILLGPGKVNDVLRTRKFIIDNAYFLQAAFQNQVDSVTWLGSYDHALLTMEPEDAVQQADAAVRLTQGSFAPEDIAGFEAGTPFARVFFQFAGYFSMQANLLRTETVKELRKAGYGRKSTRLFYLWFMGMTIPAVIGQTISKGLPDDDDDEDGDGVLDEYLKMFFGAQVSTLAAMVPIVGTVAMTAVNRFDGEVYNDRLNISPVISWVDRALSGLTGTKDVAVAAAEEDAAFVDEVSKKDVKDALTLISLVTGLPTGQIGKTAGYALDLEQGNVVPESTYELAAGLARGR